MMSEAPSFPKESGNCQESLHSWPLLQALTRGRSRGFAAGMKLNGGPLAYESTRDLRPLSAAEEAALAFAACGVTGYALADLPEEMGDRINAGGMISLPPMGSE